MPGIKPTATCMENEAIPGSTLIVESLGTQKSEEEPERILDRFDEVHVGEQLLFDSFTPPKRVIEASN